MTIVSDESTADSGSLDPATGTQASSADAARSSPPPSTLTSQLAALWYALLWGPCWAIGKAWFRYRYEGRGHVPPAGAVLLVSNHQSHLDPVLVGLASPRRLKYLARHGLFFWPFSWWIRALGAVPIDRERGGLGGMKTTLRLLRQGEAVLVFPEGTRTPHGGINPLQPGFCLLARRSGATIVPVAISGAYDAMPRGGVVPQPRPIRLTFAEAITKDDYAAWDDRRLTDEVTRRIASGLEAGQYCDE